MASRRSPELVAVFNRVREYVFPGNTKLRLLHCPKVVAEAPKTGKRRAYCHIGHWPETVCADVLKMAALSTNFTVGIFLHELGHAMTPGGTEQDADRIIFEEFGIAILYRGGLKLEWVSDVDVLKIMGPINH